MKRRLKINGLIIFLAVLLIALFPALFFRSAKTMPASSYLNETVFGIIFIILGQIFRVSARGYKSENSGSGRELIRGGPYAFVRNPMYLGICFIGMGVVAVLFQWWVVGIFLLIFIMRYISLIFEEEKKLSALFPKEYADYCKEVPRLLPLSGAIFKRDIRKYLPLKLSWVKKEIGTMLVVLSFTLAVKAWMDIQNAEITLIIKEAVAVITMLVLFTGIIIYLIKGGKGAPNKSKDS